MNEDRIIADLKQAFPEMIGDDAAVLPLLSEHLVISKDVLVENVHFRKRYQTPESLAYKALAVNLSDIAAMGASPYGVFLGISASPHDVSFVDAFLKSFVSACKEANIILMGGDTTGGPSDTLYLSITILGKGKTDTIKYRHTAKKGDAIYVAGPLGEAHLGFCALEKNIDGFLPYKSHFLNPKPRLQEGFWLAQQKSVHAMMDLSDGLWLDLHKLLNASACSAELPLEQLELSPLKKQAYLDLNLCPIETQLSGGEDYALLFTASDEFGETEITMFKKKFGYDLRQIGTIVATQNNKTHKVTLLKNNKPTDVSLFPFDHFK